MRAAYLDANRITLDRGEAFATAVGPGASTR